MKKTIQILSLAIILSACGKNETTEPIAEIKGSDPLTATEIDSFIGVYDIVRMDSEDCAASLQVIKLCEGVQVRNNHAASLSFCNVNKGEIKTGDNRSSKTVTLEANVIKLVALIFDDRSSPPGKVIQMNTDTLTIETTGILRKFSESKLGQSLCFYQKR